MPSKKKRYNARFPPARIKKIMQTDEDVGKVAAAVPVIISRALELFIESLILKANETTQSRHAKTLSTAHIKQTIEAEKKFDFLRDLVTNIPDHQTEEDGETVNSTEPKKARAPRQKKSKADGAGPSRRTDRKTSSDSSHLEVDEDDDEETESDDENDRLMNSGDRSAKDSSPHPHSSTKINSHVGTDTDSNTNTPTETFSSPGSVTEQSRDTQYSSPAGDRFISPQSNTDTSQLTASYAQKHLPTVPTYPFSHGVPPTVSQFNPCHTIITNPAFPQIPPREVPLNLSQGPSPQSFSLPVNHSTPVAAPPPAFTNLQMYKPPVSEDDDYDA